MKIDKKSKFNDFLDRLSRGGMKGVWNYFNTQQRKIKRNIVQLDNTHRNIQELLGKLILRTL